MSTMAAMVDRPETTEEQLAREGWLKRCSAIEPRLSELIALYTELGFEVRCEPIDLAQLPREACRECFLVQYERYKTIYTRVIIKSYPERCEGSRDSSLRS